MMMKLDNTGTIATPLATLTSELSVVKETNDAIDVAATFVDADGNRHFVVSLKSATCDDTGTYVCHLDRGQNQSATISSVIVPNNTITLTMPDDVISDAAYNITCDAAVQEGKMFVLQQRDTGQSEFVDTALQPVVTFPTDGPSQCRRRAHFENVYDMSWNNTELRCQTRDRSQESTEEILLVISGDFCLDYPMASTQAHPYTPHKYFYCFGEFISIFGCPLPTFVWVQSRETCVPPEDALALDTKDELQITQLVVFTSPTTTTSTTTSTTTTAQVETTTEPKTEITMLAANHTLGNRADAICNVTGSNWNTIMMIQINDIGMQLIASFSRDGLGDLTTKSGVTLSRSQEGRVYSLRATYDDIQCADSGQYVCSAETGTNEFAEIRVTSPIEKLTLSAPPYMTSYTVATFECSGITDKDGRIYLAVKGPNDVDFSELFLPGQVASETEVDDCRKSVTKSITITFDMASNGSYIRCESTSQSESSDVYQMLILPERYCDGEVSGVTKIYPYNCQYYVTCLPQQDPVVQACAPGLCYDVDRQSCELAQSVADSGDPYSCVGKGASSYIPQPGTCTDYKWCVNGQSVPGTCPPSTFFSATNPPCTNIPEEAVCSVEQLKAEGFTIV